MGKSLSFPFRNYAKPWDTQERLMSLSPRSLLCVTPISSWTVSKDSCDSCILWLWMKGIQCPAFVQLRLMMRIIICLLESPSKEPTAKWQCLPSCPVEDPTTPAVIEVFQCQLEASKHRNQLGVSCKWCFSSKVYLGFFFFLKTDGKNEELYHDSPTAHHCARNYSVSVVGTIQK